ncbi:MAG TPA: L-dopachrome tautomerase-related protein [Lamprocystis sp. (in: g-proteobacteria)]|nr:L-dopachrome tautomerase-related protein [Lamprocystis sp. (in: g-proteobacteria)]
MRPLLAALLLALSLIQPLLATADEQLLTGTIEGVAELPINPGNLAVTATGRVFATVHQFRRAEAQLIEIKAPGRYQPWPDKAWNGAFGSGPDVLNSVLGIHLDHQGRLWVLDNGLGEPNQTPKLVAFSLASGKPVFRYDFPPETGPVGGFLNDLAVDDARGFVYLADVGGSHEPALVVLDLNQRTSRRFTASPALQAEDLDLVVDGRVIGPRGADGTVSPARVAVNPITLSADGETLYFGAMNGKTWYRVPARLLREGASDEAIAAAITKAGSKPVSDGAATDAAGNHYFTDLGNNAITVLGADGRLETLVQDDRLSWPDSLSFGEPGWLYIAVNQLHRAPRLNGGVEGGELPFRIMRVYTGTEDQGGR